MTQLTDLISVDNLDDPVPVLAHKATVYGLVISSLVLVTICVLMRLYVRIFVTRSPGYDDYFIILTFMIIFAANIGCCFLVEAGLGEHLLVLGLEGLAKFTKTFWWALGLYNMALALVKISLLFQYLRIADERPEIQQPRLRIFTLVMIGVVTLWGVAQSLLAWIPCNPVEADWDFTGTPAIRWGYGSRDVATFTGTFYQHSASNMILDIIVLGMPLFSKPLWATAKDDVKSRRGMIGLFFLGSITVSCSIIRFASQVSNKAGTYPSFDPTFYGASVTVLSVLEVNLATIAATLPVFWPHLRRNIEAIMVTREISVKITRQSAAYGHSRGFGSTSLTTAGGMIPVPDLDIERHGGGGGGGGGGSSSSAGGDAVGAAGDWGYDSRTSRDDPWMLPKMSDTLQLTEIRIEDKGLESGLRSESRARGRSDSRLGHVTKPSRLWTSMSSKEGDNMF